MFRAMENLLRRYARRLQAGQPGWDPQGDPKPSSLVTQRDAMAAAHQLAGYVAALADRRFTPDPGAAAASLMVIIEYIAPQPADLTASFEDDLRAVVSSIRELGI